MISNSAKRKAADQGIYKPFKIIREEIVNSPVELTQQLNSNDINRIRKIHTTNTGKTIRFYQNPLIIHMILLKD